MRGRTAGAVVAANAALALVFSAQAFAQTVSGGFDQGRANTVGAPRGQVLATGAGAAPADLVANYLRTKGIGAATVASLRQAGMSTSRNGIVHLRMEQQVGGLTVYGRYVKAAINPRGQLLHVIENLAAVPSVPLASATITAQQALQAAMTRLHPDAQASVGPGVTRGNATTFARGAFFHDDPTVTRVAVPMTDGSMTEGLLVETWSRAKNRLHHTLIGRDGRVLDVQLRTATDSYNVFPTDPGKNAQVVKSGPGAGNAESPAGWLGTGSQLTTAISGNNASAYLDTDANNRSDRGGTAVMTGDFLAVADLGVSPSTATNQAVAVQNLFYLNNVVHDILYRHGFDEQAGNFQDDNFGQGGKGRDPVQAEAQDGSGIDNANFATPPDGRKPRMQMYLWTGAGATHRLTVNGTNFAAMGAEFGPALSATGVTGQMVATAPADGCAAITTPLSGRVALIDRGTCDFSTKALNAQSAGAVAVVIANNQGGTAIFTMGAGSGANRVRIPAVMISQNDGTTLRPQTPVTATAARLETQPLQIDASLDSDVVYHEYGHGLTWRMIGGMSGPLAGAIGEGMSDGVAMLINGDDVIGEYSSSSPSGIRRFRYEGYPLTYKDVTGAEVHDDGEIYAAIVWKMIDLFKKQYDVAGPGRLFAYVVDGMNYTPSTPTYEQMRDGILASVLNGPAPSDCDLVWNAFGRFGVGAGAQAVVSGSTVQITESFVVPNCH